jgi:hypothetical protein
MAKDVEQQGEDRNAKLDRIIQSMVEAKEAEEAAAESIISQTKLSTALQDKGNTLSADQTNQFGKLLESLNGDSGLKAEERKEANAKAQQLLDLLGEIADNTADLGKIDSVAEGAFASLLSIPTILLGLTAGLVVGITESFAKIVKVLGKSILKAVAPIVKSVLGLWKTLFGGVFKLLNKIPFVKSFTTAIGGFFKSFKAGFVAKTGGLSKSIGNVFKVVTNGLKNMKSAFSAGFNGLKVFRNATGQFGKLGFFGRIGKILSSIASPFKAMGNMLKAFKNYVLAPMKGIGAVLAPIKSMMPSGGSSKLVKPAMEAIKRVMSIMRSVGKAAFMFGRVLGRLFLPITVLMSVFDTFKGALSGFDKYKDKGFLEGIIGGLFGGISGLLTGLIGMPLDLLKDGVSWIASKLGFENFSEQLDSFSFSDMISNLFTSITDTIVGFIGSIKDSIADIGFGGMLANMGIELMKIFKKIATFPLAVAAGAVNGLAAAWPGGDTPGEAFMKGFNKVQNFGDASIDTMKIQGDGMNEKGEQIKTTSAENAQGQANLGTATASNSTVAVADNSKKSNVTTTIINSQPKNRIGDTLQNAYG